MDYKDGYFVHQGKAKTVAVHREKIYERAHNNGDWRQQMDTLTLNLLIAYNFT